MRSQPFFLLLLVAFPACHMKTRAELREEGVSFARTPLPVRVASPVAVEPSANDLIRSLREQVNGLESRLQSMEKESLAGEDANDKETQDFEERIKLLEQTVTQLAESLQSVERRFEAIQSWMKHEEERASKTVKNPQEVFQAAKKACTRNEHEACLDLCGKLLQTNVKTTSSMRAECLMLRGNVFQAKKEHKKAILEWTQITEGYAKSNLVPVVMLKISESFSALGMKSDSRAFLEELIHKHPKSKQATQARNHLKR